MILKGLGGNSFTPFLFAVFSLFLLCSGCSFEPENVHDMLLYANKNYPSSSDKTLAVYKKFGQEGEEALIRVFFNIAPQGQPYYDAEVKKAFETDGAPVRGLVAKLSEDEAFLRAILDVSKKYRRTEAAFSTGEYAWVLRNNKALFQAWVNGELALNDTRLANVWKTYFLALPDEAFNDSFGLMQRYVAEIGAYAHTWPWLEQELTAYKKNNPKAVLSPERFRFVFANNLDGSLFKEWRLSASEWIRRHPEDFGLALWRNNPQGAGTTLYFTIYEKDYPRSAVTPTQSGDKVMLFYDRSDAKYGVGKDEKNLITLETMRMRNLLPRTVTAESLKSYDRQIVIALTPVEVAKYTMMRSSGVQLVPVSSETVQGIRWKMTVTYSELVTGKVLAKKEFLGPKPPESKQTQGRVAYIAGDTPWHDVNEYIKSLFPAPEPPKKTGVPGM